MPYLLRDVYILLSFLKDICHQKWDNIIYQYPSDEVATVKYRRLSSRKWGWVMKDVIIFSHSQFAWKLCQEKWGFSYNSACQNLPRECVDYQWHTDREQGMEMDHRQSLNFKLVNTGSVR